MVGTPQAVIKIVRNGGTRTPAQIKNQWEYISKDGTVDLEQPDYAQGAPLTEGQRAERSRDWAEGSGRYTRGQAGPADVDMTTHIVVSFPPGTDQDRAYAASRAWAERMFQHGGDVVDEDMDDDDFNDDEAPYNLPQRYNYVSAFHTDREHPHMHIVVNRRGDEGGWLKISRRHPVMNYDNMREVLVETAAEQGIDLEATTRAERGLEGRGMNDAEYRRRERERLIDIRPGNNTNRPLDSDSESEDGLDYSVDSSVDYAAYRHDGLRAPAANANDAIPAEINVPAAAPAAPAQAAPERMQADAGYDGDDERVPARRRDRDDNGEAGPARRRRRNNADGDGIEGAALDAWRANADETLAGPVEDGPARNRRRRDTADGTVDAAGVDAWRANADAALAEQQLQSRNENGPAGRRRERDGDEEQGPARQRQRRDRDGDGDSNAGANAAADNAANDAAIAPPIDGEFAQGVAPEPAPRQRGRREVPPRHMTLRSDTARQRAQEEADGMRLRSGRIIPRPAQGEPDNRNDEPHER